MGERMDVQRAVTGEMCEEGRREEGGGRRKISCIYPLTTLAANTLAGRQYRLTCRIVVL